MAAIAAARRREARRRRLLWLGGGALLAAGVIWLVANTGSDDTDVATTDSPTTSIIVEGSVAGQPCVAVSEPLPAGAPEVPVEVGPPPAQLVKKDLKVGTGATVAPNATVTVNYIGVACTTGKIFDSSYSRNMPATFGLAQVIKGWQDGIPGMNVGGQRLLGIPSAQAYGAAGRAPGILPDEPLWFVVEVSETKAS